MRSRKSKQGAWRGAWRPFLRAASGLCALAAVFPTVQGCVGGPVKGSAGESAAPTHGAPATAGGRVVAIWWGDEKESAAQISPPDFMDLKERSRSFEHLAAFVPGAVDLTPEGGGRLFLHRTSVSHEFFKALGVAPALGRAFGPQDDWPGRDRVAILSHQLWSRQFGSDPGIIGRTITLGGEGHTVVGVMPQSFRYPRVSGQPTPFEFPTATDIWTPLALEYRQMSRGLNFLKVVARLREGVTPEQAQAELEALASRRTGQAAPAGREWRVRVTPLSAGP